MEIRISVTLEPDSLAVPGLQSRRFGSQSPWNPTRWQYRVFSPGGTKCL